MFAAKSWVHASFRAGRRWLRPARSAEPTAAAGRAATPGIVPIRALSAAHRERVRGHLLALGAADRVLRFGWRASDAQVEAYVDRLDFVRDQLFGIFNRRLDLIALAHLALAPRGPSGQPGDSADLGLSVLPHARGRGYGGRLFARAAMQARNTGVGRLAIQALGRNAAMLRIARRAGATVQRSGPDAEAWLNLPPATLDSRIRLWRAAQLGETDYRLKRDAKRLRDWIARRQEAWAVRPDVQGGGRVAGG